MTRDAITDTPTGRLRGLFGPEGVEFLGIAYATAERFAPPVATPSWAGVRDATRAGPAAPQPVRPASVFAHGPLPPTSERDCLVLNVFSPSLAGRRPVLVWLHGGGFAVGHSTASLYHGASLAGLADAVVVTLNYRLGSAGWLAHDLLRAGYGEPAGNWGLLDQVAALEWVRDNICMFGGDPGAVTLAGQSAGALCVADMLAVPRADGLFARAILQSPPLRDAAQPAAVAVQWAAGLSRLATGHELFDADALRRLPVDRLVALHETLMGEAPFRGTRGGALPTIEQASLPRTSVECPDLRTDVDVLIGTTADEGTFFFDSPWSPVLAPAAVGGIVARIAGADAVEALVARHREDAGKRGAPQDLPSLLPAIATDAMFAAPVVRWAHSRALAGGRVHRYRVDHPGAGARLRATHTVEVPLLFGTWRDGGPGERLGGQAAGSAEVAAAIAGTWRSFVHGEPLAWRAAQHGEVGVFGGDAPFTMQHEENQP